MTNTSILKVGTRRAVAALGLAVAGFAWGCDSTDTILQAVDPDLINPPDTRSAEGAQAIYFGALNRLRQITGGTGGEGSVWLFGGLLADEWSTSSTFVQNDETDQRMVQYNNGTVTGMYRDLARARTSANQAIALLTEFPRVPGTPENLRIGEMYFVRGWAEMQLADNFCNGVALSDGTGEVIVYGPQMPVADVYTVAIASFDSALALITGTDTASVRANRSALMGKARSMLGLGQVAAAGALVAGIPTTYTHNVTFATTSGDLTLWAQPFSARRYTVGDSVEGNSRTLLVRNAIPFFSKQDPRLPARYTVQNSGKDTVKSQDGLTFSRTTTLWLRTTPTAVASGVDARMIEAEGLLFSGNVAGWLAIHNALRAAPPKLGEITPAAMPALVAPPTTAEQIDLHFREKAFWTFGRGQRLADLRRLVRQYGRLPTNTFPEGVCYRGGNYGPDMNLPVPQAEQNNELIGPNTSTCIDRNA